MTAKIIHFGRELTTFLGCHVLHRKQWQDGYVVEHVTLWVDEDEDELSCKDALT